MRGGSRTTRGSLRTHGRTQRAPDNQTPRRKRQVHKVGWPTAILRPTWVRARCTGLPGRGGVNGGAGGKQNDQRKPPDTRGTPTDHMLPRRSQTKMSAQSWMANGHSQTNLGSSPVHWSSGARRGERRCGGEAERPEEAAGHTGNPKKRQITKRQEEEDGCTNAKKTKSEGSNPSH